MHALLYLRAKAALYRPDYAALRFSYGLNGILLPARDARALASFLLRPRDAPDNDLPDAPVDHLTYRWLRGKYARARAYLGARRIVAFRHTLFWHVGDASAVGNGRARHKPKCYATSKEWLFEQESFHEDECPDDDVWPCAPRPAPGSAAFAALRDLEARTVAHTAGADKCDAHRVCWGRPTAAKAKTRGGATPAGDGGGRCTARLQCPRPKGVPCVPALPEYAA